jgi:hypothetical protein
LHVSSALVVDEIRENEQGGVDLLGLREELYFDTLPVLLERLTLFLDLVVAPADRGARHAIDLSVIDPNGTVLKSIPIRFTLPADYPRPTAPLDPTLFEVPFQQFGPHTVEIQLGETTVRRLPLFILQRDSGVTE